MIGKVVSHYKILEHLGHGGMGIVYKAQDTKLDRPVALKFLPMHVDATNQDKARLLQEAKSAAALNHPNICSVIDVQEQDDQMFIVMEYIEGQTLKEKMASMTFKQAIETGIQVADGLSAAHEKGVVHRDIKPENIMIRKDGIAQIMDFGLAKLQGVSRLTKEGSTVGTAAYMSPEQLEGHDVDHRSDIFSLGVVLYELFTHQLPFRGVHESALTYEIVNVEPPSMVTIRPDIDPALDAVVMDCLEKDPTERTQSVKQVSVNLKRVQQDSDRQRTKRNVPARRMHESSAPIEGVPSRKLTPGRLLWPSISGILAIGLLFAGWVLWKGPGIPHPVGRFVITLPKDQSLDILSAPAIAVSPDGSRIVYKANGRFYQRRMESFNPEPILGTEGGGSPFFSPDGKWVAFFAAGQLKRVPLGGTVAFDVAEAPNPRGGTWLKDGTIVFSPVGRGGLLRVNEEGGEVRELTRLDTAKSERTHRWPHCLPDGKTVTFTVGTMGSPDYYEDATIESVNLETGERRTLLKGASTACYLPTGYLVYSNIGTLFAIPFDPVRLETRGASTPVVNTVASDATTGAINYSNSENGLLAYIPGQSGIDQGSLELVDELGKVSSIIASPRAYVDQRMSPDGRHVAVAIRSGKDFDIWVIDIQRNTSSRLTFGGSNRSPVWSPDSRRLAYSNNTAGPNQTAGRSKVVIVRADGTGLPEEIPLNKDRNYVNCWSHDGATIIVTVPEQGMGWDLWALPVNRDRTPRTILSTKSDESFASLSPNGKWIAYISNETGFAQVYVRPFPGGVGKWQISTDIATRVDWSADGRTLFFGTQQGIMSVSVQGTQSLIVGQPQVFLKGFRGLLVESAINYDIAPDGKHVLLTLPEEGSDVHQQINVVLNWFDEIQHKAGSTN